MIASVLNTSPGLRAASAWIDSRSRRERVLILGMALLAAVAVLWYGLAQPLIRAREAATLRIESAAQLKAKLSTASSTAVAPAPAPLDGSVSEILTQRAEEVGLSFTRMEPAEGGQGAGLVIDDARYEAAMNFIATLEGTDGMQVQHLTIDSAGSPGLVRVQMRVVRP